MSQLFVGVDGGGSKTEVVVVDRKGKERASRVGEASAIRPGEALHTAEVITDLIRDAAGNYLVLEDNLRCPSGASYMIETARRCAARCPRSSTATGCAPSRATPMTS